MEIGKNLKHYGNRLITDYGGRRKWDTAPGTPAWGTLRDAAYKGIPVPELAEAVAGLFTRLWSTCTKSSRASLALRVFPGLTEGELQELVLADAYVNILDDFLDLKCLDDTRGSGARALYVRMLLLANTLLQSPEARIFLGELGARKVFDSEYQIRLALEKESLGLDEALDVVEQAYISQAHGAWLFFAYPAGRRLPRGEAEALTRAGVLFRALWLVLDHLEDLEEDRENNAHTGIRYLVDILGKPALVAALAGRLDALFHESLARVGESVYKRNLLAEYDALRHALEEEMARHGITWQDSVSL